jgi:hypothetical protein
MLPVKGVTMKTTKTILAIAIALAGFTAAGSALAQHRHHHHGSRLVIGLGIGLPLAAYSYYGYPRYAYYPPYYPAPVVYQEQAPVYVEQNPPPAAAPQPSNSWYFCPDSRAYYPYVKECRSGWQRVAPQPG